MPGFQALLDSIRELQTELMRLAPYRDAGLVPNPAATAATIEAAETRIGRRLPPGYRAFLSQHDGWPRFFEGASLLGAAQLGRPDFDAIAYATFAAAETPLPELAPSQRARLLPFGIDPQGVTIFAFDTATMKAGGEYQVIAWVGEIGLRRASFEAFLETVRELCEAELESLTAVPLLRIA